MRARCALAVSGGGVLPAIAPRTHHALGLPPTRTHARSLIAAPQGIHMLCGDFPRLKVITSEIDEGIDDNFRVVPGVGEFGDRYFCEG